MGCLSAIAWTSWQKCLVHDVSQRRRLTHYLLIGLNWRLKAGSMLVGSQRCSQRPDQERTVGWTSVFNARPNTKRRPVATLFDPHFMCDIVQDFATSTTLHNHLATSLDEPVALRDKFATLRDKSVTEHWFIVAPQFR